MIVLDSYLEIFTMDQNSQFVELIEDILCLVSNNAVNSNEQLQESSLLMYIPHWMQIFTSLNAKDSKCISCS